MSKKLLLRIGLNTLLGVVLVLVWLKFVNLHEVIETLKTVKPNFLILFFFFMFLSTILRGIRLWLLIKPVCHPRPDRGSIQFISEACELTLLDSRLPAGRHGLRGNDKESEGRRGILDFVALGFVSQLLSFFIPIRAGEMAKTVYLSTQYTLPFGKSLVWVFIDRFLDFFGVLLLLAVFLPIVPNNLGDGAWYLVVAGLLGFLSVAILSIYSQSKAKRFFNFMSKFLIFEKLKKIFLSLAETIIEGFLVLKRDFKEMGGLIGLTIIALISDSLIWVFMFLSLNENIGILTAVLGTQLSALTFLIPAAPGYVGSLEASALAVWSLSLNVPSQLASAAAVLFHILTVVMLLIFGFISIYFLKFDLNLVWNKLKRKN